MLLLCLGHNGQAQSALEWARSVLQNKDAYTDLNAGDRVDLCDSLCQVFSDHQDSCGLAEALAIRSRNKIKIGTFEDAIVDLQSANHLISGLDCKPRIQLSLARNYVDLYDQMGEIERSDSFATLALTYWTEYPVDTSDLAYLYLSKGSTLQGLNSPQAMTYYDSALAIAEQLGMNKLIAFVYNNIALIYYDRGMTDSAHVVFKEALNVLRAVGGEGDLSMAFTNLAGTSPNNALKLRYADSALFYAKASGFLMDVMETTWNLSMAHANLGQYKPAFEYMDQAFILSDSFLNLEKVKVVHEMQEKYESEKKAREIEKLNLNKLSMELNAVRLKRNQVVLLLLILAIAAIAGVFIYRFVHVRNIRNSLSAKNIELDEQRKMSDELLLNILPSEVANELKEKGESKARMYDNVTILFSDFVSFTEIGGALSPNELVGEINRQFTAFDLIIEKHGLEKIKTIGDAYLAVCGLPEKHEDHAKRVLNAAFEIRDFAMRSDSMFKIRIGINSGSVVAGIVGVKKYAYDIWGDAVNTASRMETSGDPGKINVSPSTYELLKDDHAFKFEHRGRIETKGKGELDMWFADLA